MKFTSIGIADISGLRARTGLRSAVSVRGDRRRPAVFLNERHLGACAARVGAPTIPVESGMSAAAEVHLAAVTGDARTAQVQPRKRQGKSMVPPGSSERQRLAIV